MPLHLHIPQFFIVLLVVQQTAQDQHCGIQSKSRQVANRYLDEFQTVLAIKCEQVIKHLKKNLE